ncbi:MAG: hypothetical protein GY781_05580 [Gammaproteobacteria bacterium]|nr:hypothetical protein [Gammaproteobacteria bacterium]
MITVNHHFRSGQLQPIPVLFVLLMTVMTMVGGCSMLGLATNNKPAVINEPGITSIAIEPYTLPETKLPASSLTKAKDSYLNLLGSTQSDAIKAESLQRLAEIESMIAESKLVQGQQDEMQVHLQLAASYYETLLKNHPEKAQQTKIRYQLAHIYDLNGKQASSQTILSGLAQLKGTEHEVIEAGFRMAENAYSQKQYPKALSLYNKVLSYKNQPESGQLNSFYNTALFKRGWTHFKRQHYDLAVADFISLLDIIYLKPEQRSVANNNLIKETYRVSALGLSYMNGAESLSGYFSRRGHKDYEAELYLSLADLYNQQQRYQDTASTYFIYVKSNPLSVEAPEFEHKGILVLSKSGFIDLVLGAKENFVEHYQTGADYWQKTQSVRTEKISKWLYANLDDVINFYHAKAQKSKLKSDYQAAAKWYRVFLNSFQDHPKTNDKRWLLAESLHDSGDIKASINEYQRLAYDENGLVAKRKDEAGFRVLLGNQTLFKQLEEDKTSDTESIQLARKQLIVAGLKYKTGFTGNKRVPLVVAQTIELQLGAGATRDAVDLSRTMKSTKWASKEQLKRSREVIANGEFDLKNYKLAEQAFTDIFNSDRYKSEKMQIFHERRAQSIYKQAEALKQEKQYAEAVEQLLRIGKVEPKSKVRVNAEFDAATLLLQIKNYTKAIVVLKQFAVDYPNNPLTASIPSKLIVSYEALENWSAAAKQYEIVSGNTKNIELARTASWQVAASWMKLSDKKSRENSVAAWKKYIKKYPKPFDLSLEARNHLITLYGQLNVTWKQNFWRRKIILTVDANKLQEVRARTLAAQSQISLSTDDYKLFKAIKLTQPLRKSLKKKRQKLNASLKGFSKVLDYRIQPLATQAGFRIGELYAILASSMLESERPKGMTELELEEYEILLEEKAFPFEDKAIEALEANISLTTSAVWDQWIKKSFSELELLMPARYLKPEIIDDYVNTP